MKAMVSLRMVIGLQIQGVSRFVPSQYWCELTGLVVGLGFEDKRSLVDLVGLLGDSLTEKVASTESKLGLALDR
jgi:hypothetical protein